MTKLGLQPYKNGDAPPPKSVPVSVIILTCNEEPNIGRCLRSVAWADQAVVVDSGSSDNTMGIARSLGAEVVEQPWLGYSGQREFALRLPGLRYDWVYFVDADEWVSALLADEVRNALEKPSCAGFAHRLRLVFLDTWIRHCGWYRGSWVVRLVDRRYAKFDGSAIGERAVLDGPLERLRHDIVDEDRKGLAKWLVKHVQYAQIASATRGKPAPFLRRLREVRACRSTRPLARAVLKDVLFPAVPAKPLALFLYMYVARLGFLDGVTGLRFCFYHAWYEASIAALRRHPTGTGANERPGH